MSVRRLAAEQPASFAFTPDNLAWAKTQIAKFPEGRQASAVIPLLWRAQEQHAYWLPKPAIEYVADMLAMPRIRVLEVATFYTMFNLEPVGRWFIQLCGTTPCRLNGAGDIVKVCEERIGQQRHVTPDGLFSWLEVECLGSCCNAPMVQINNDYYEDLTPETFNRLLDDLAAGRPVKRGPQNGRQTSEPKDGPLTLTDPALFDGSVVGAWKQRFAEEEIKAREAAERTAAEKAAKEAAERAAAAAPVAAAQPAAAPAAVHPSARPSDPRPEAATGKSAEPVAATKPPVSSADSAKTSAPAAASAGVPAAVQADGVTGSKPVTATAGTQVISASNASAAVVPADEPPPSEADVAAAGKALAVSDEFKPALLAAPEGGKGDNLELIWGVGPKLAVMMNKMGVWHFRQIASWTDMNLRWVDQNLGTFKGRAVRDKWIEQAVKLASGWRPENDIGDKPKG
ncbi:MAG: NADH-quinone oxidoreductase subunit NuoE [Alsobacter sp.]